MEYRGKNYTIVQGVEPDTWKWAVQLDENRSNLRGQNAGVGRNQCGLGDW
jgi:hypothetical protein